MLYEVVDQDTYSGLSLRTILARGRDNVQAAMRHDLPFGPSTRCGPLPPMGRKRATPESPEPGSLVVPVLGPQKTT